MPEVAIPRYTGKAQYATRILLPNMLWGRLLTSPHPRAKVKRLDVSKAEKMPGVAYILTPGNAPKSYPLPDELFFQGEIVAIVAADSEDLAHDAADAIEVEYDLLPFAATLQQVMAPDAPELRRGRGNVIRSSSQYGDVEKAFAQADVVKEFTYQYSSGIPVPLQPVGGVAKWDGDKLTFYGMGQGIYPQRASLARALDIAETNIRFINKWNGGSFGGAMAAARLNPWIAYIAKQTGRPFRLTLPKDQELAQMQVKPANIQKFKVGATKDGRIIACQREFHVNNGSNAGAGQQGGGGRSELYVHVIPNWKEIGFQYRTNSIQTGPSRSNMQQEFKFGWEQMMDEMAEAVGMDPVQCRLLNVQKPGTNITHARRDAASVRRDGPGGVPAARRPSGGRGRARRGRRDGTAGQPSAPHARARRGVMRREMSRDFRTAPPVRCGAAARRSRRRLRVG